MSGVLCHPKQYLCNQQRRQITKRQDNGLALYKRCLVERDVTLLTSPRWHLKRFWGWLCSFVVLRY